VFLGEGGASETAKSVESSPAIDCVLSESFEPQRRSQKEREGGRTNFLIFGTRRAGGPPWNQSSFAPESIQSFCPSLSLASSLPLSSSLPLACALSLLPSSSLPLS